MPELTLESPLLACYGIGEQTALKCEAAGLRVLRDLLFFLPLRYEDKTRLTCLSDLAPCDGALIQGEVVSNRVLYGRRRTWQLELCENGHTMVCRFFYFSSEQQRNVKIGDTVRCFGAVRATKQGFEMVHPEYRVLNPLAPNLLETTLSPVYPALEGLTNKRLMGLVQQALKALRHYPVIDYLDKFLKEYPSLHSALECLHRPTPDVSLMSLTQREHPALERLVIEELVSHQLMFRRQRAQWDSDPSKPMEDAVTYMAPFIACLPFNPTGAQLRVMGEVASSLEKSVAMNRLLQGDVGSGKTVIAGFAAYVAYRHGLQVAFMAPTELLAQQHALTLKRWFEPFAENIILMTGSTKAKPYQATLEALKSGAPKIIVGTHALFQSSVEFTTLGLVIIDEQHRFGVEQRKQLMKKTGEHYQAHQLIMTATPIPRTLAMSLYADLDTSVLDELPPLRSPIQTVLISSERRVDIIQRIKVLLSEGKQAYWVCSLIEENEILSASAAEMTFEMLKKALNEFSVGLIHGKMPAAEKDTVMQSFRAGEVHLLVSTTVIEVGVDVPNATLMVIENAERFGLAQLHQLRGRVGRGAAQSHCVLMYDAPLSQTAQSRLQIMRETQDGFVIADKDLELRGPGEVLGTRQKGSVRYRVADLGQDAHLLKQARAIALAIEQETPDLVSELMDRWFAGNQVYRNV